jgi:hypothetical protein
MDTGKQALTKPRKKVGVPQKKGWTEEGKVGEPAVPRRQTCAARSTKGGYWSVRSRRALRALKSRGLSKFSAGPFLRTCLKPHALCVSNLSTGSSRAGLDWVQPHTPRVWPSARHHRHDHGDNRHPALRPSLLH